MAIDINSAYPNDVSGNLGNAQVLYDKFQDIQNLVEARDGVWKAESRSDAGKRALWERTRWLWLKNRVD